MKGAGTKNPAFPTLKRRQLVHRVDEPRFISRRSAPWPPDARAPLSSIIFPIFIYQPSNYFRLYLSSTSLKEETSVHLTDNHRVPDSPPFAMNIRECLKTVSRSVIDDKKNFSSLNVSKRFHLSNTRLYIVVENSFSYSIRLKRRIVVSRL